MFLKTWFKSEPTYNIRACGKTSASQRLQEYVYSNTTQSHNNITVRTQTYGMYHKSFGGVWLFCMYDNDTDTRLRLILCKYWIRNFKRWGSIIGDYPLSNFFHIFHTHRNYFKKSSHFSVLIPKSEFWKQHTAWIKWECCVFCDWCNWFLVGVYIPRTESRWSGYNQFTLTIRPLFPFKRS